VEAAELLLHRDEDGEWERVDEGVQERFLELVQTKELPEGLGTLEYWIIC